MLTAPEYPSGTHEASNQNFGESSNEAVQYGSLQETIPHDLNTHEENPQSHRMRRHSLLESRSTGTRSEGGDEQQPQHDTSFEVADEQRGLEALNCDSTNTAFSVRLISRASSSSQDDEDFDSLYDVSVDGNDGEIGETGSGRPITIELLLGHSQSSSSSSEVEAPREENILTAEEAAELEHTDSESDVEDHASSDREDEQETLEALSDMLRHHPANIAPFMSLQEPPRTNIPVLPRPIRPTLAPSPLRRVSTPDSDNSSSNSMSSEANSDAESSPGEPNAPSGTPANEREYNMRESQSLNLEYLDEELMMLSARRNQPPPSSVFDLRPRVLPVQIEDSAPLNPHIVRELRYRGRPGLSCQHDTILRYYADKELLQCPDCKGRYRYLYVCTADTEDFSVQEGQGSGEPRGSIDILSPWIIEAIKQGHYTSEQVDIMIQQKLDVLRAAKRDRNQFVSPTPSPSPSGEEGPRFIEEWIEDVSDARPTERDTAERKRQAEEHYRKMVNRSNAFIEQNSPCKMRVCAVCLPRLAECAWESIDDIVEKPYKAPPHIPEYINRPIINAAVVLNMDWTKKLSFQSWYGQVQRRNPQIDLFLVLELAVGMRLSELQGMQLITWVINRRMSGLRFFEFLRWMWSACLSRSQALHFLGMIGNSRLLRQQTRTLASSRPRREARATERGAETPLSAYPIWEEEENELGELTETPGFAYDDREPMGRRIDHHCQTVLFSAMRAGQDLDEVVIRGRVEGRATPRFPPGLPINEPQGSLEADDSDDLYT
ncbi:hypothetical protein NUU61_004403 [Penicillium alfredii]|uniref:Uncharacterized protein n=1 Tax=Penicillium alfredii TaxID=1506179 RepID=A0A9W9KDU3_9EURO|nr:uncharacterized protein NUU61_004403 [Penicillium alfredii]KAJ5102181.1 hypothetical protein NUU61_004403 [Penicillium alfredii]